MLGTALHNAAELDVQDAIPLVTLTALHVWTQLDPGVQFTWC